MGWIITFKSTCLIKNWLCLSIFASPIALPINICALVSSPAKNASLAASNDSRNSGAAAFNAIIAGSLGFGKPLVIKSVAKSFTTGATSFNSCKPFLSSSFTLVSRPALNANILPCLDISGQMKRQENS